MLAGDQAAFYNDVYTRQPSKWSSVDRDYLAFKILSGLVDNPGRMMDFGCGNGHTLAFFHSQWPDATYIGVDISDVAIKLTRRRVPNVITIRNWHGIPECDVITIMGVAEHFEDPAAELKEIAALLKPTGYLYLEVPNCLAYSPDKTEGYRKTHEGSDQVEWHWTRDTWKQAIKDAGLEIVMGYKGHAPECEFIWVLRRTET